MSDNSNQNQDQKQDPFAHPIKKNNWWLYIFGAIVLAGIIIWFFIDWSYKDRNREPAPVEEIQQTPVQDQEQVITLPTDTVIGVAGK